MQSAGDLVGVIVEFSAGVQGGHDDFCGGELLFFVQVNRDAAPVVNDRYRIVAVDTNFYV